MQDRWSVGHRRRGIGPGDRVFLLRQGVEPRGIVASGHATSPPFSAAHWNGRRDQFANYVEVDWDRVADLDDVLPTQLLVQEMPATHWNTQSGGIAIASSDVDRLEELWAHRPNPRH